MHPGGALLIKAEFNELIKFKELPLIGMERTTVECVMQYYSKEYTQHS
jgi:hypothetical protein